MSIPLVNIQGENYDIALIKNVLNCFKLFIYFFIRNFRSVNQFNAILVVAGETATETDWNKKLLNLCLDIFVGGKDNSIMNIRMSPYSMHRKYKIEFFHRLVDTVINFQKKDFLIWQHHNIFYHIYELKAVSSSVILKNFTDLETLYCVMKYQWWFLYRKFETYNKYEFFFNL